MLRGAKIAGLFLLAGVWVSIGSADAGIWTDPNSFAINIIEGCRQTEVLTIGNDGSEDLNFSLRCRETSRGISGVSSGGGAVAKVVKTDGDNIILEYEFGNPIVSKIGEYDTVQIKGLDSYQRTGAPIVPMRPATILVPFGKKVIGGQVIPLNRIELPGTYRLAPAQKPYPLNFKGITVPTEPDAAIYGREAPWPGKDYEQKGTYSKRGYQLCVLNLFPVQYEPVTGKLIYATKMRLEVKLGDSTEKTVLKPAQRTASTLSRKVDNPGVLASYDAKTVSVEKVGALSTLPGGGPYQYVIITNQALESAPGPWNFQALRDSKIAHGVTATIVKTEWIYANYNGTKPSGGSDNQTQIRNFLIDAYQNWGTQYVLLGGTNVIVPARMFYVDSLVGDIDYMPVDMYYGCVDPPQCTFDYDADNKYGEPTDGVGGGDVDLFAEIYVGRAPVENSTELANFVRKTLAYDSTQAEYLPRIAMVGEYIGFGGPSEYATESMEQIRTGGTFDGYFTYGFENHIQPDFIDFNTQGCLPAGDCWPLYDAEGYDWPKQKLLSLMNGGVHCFNHLGHANYTDDMKLSTSDLGSLTNTDYFFAYSQGCEPGGFDTSNCFAEVLTTVEHGAFGAVMNARYGYGVYDSTDGPSQRYARQFWDAVLGEDKLEMGRANQDSKEDNISSIGGECMRWCYYELNLFGDPQQEFRFEESCEWITLEPNEGTIGPGESSDISVTFDAVKLMPGTYGAEIIVVSNDIGNPQKIIPVTMTVSADALQVSPAAGFESVGSEGGPFEPECMDYTLTNVGETAVNWTALKSREWFTIMPPDGVLEPGASIDVNVCINTNADLLDPNVYSQVLTFQNLNSGSIKQRTVTLTVKPPDLFTESFDAGGNFAGVSLTLRPNGLISCYEACRDVVNAFPTDPNGGTYLPLGDDDFAQVVLADGKEVMFYNQSYDRFYVGSNGYITFGVGDTEYEGLLANHFSLPRISGYFTDLTPAGSQDISFRQLEDRVVVTFDGVPIYGDKTAKSSFQIEIFFADGAIRITWLKIAAGAGVAGLSEGKGLPPELFEESNFRAYPVCWPMGDFNKDYTVDLADLGIFVSYWLNDDCNYPLWCDRTDLDCSSAVEPIDFSIFAQNWRITKSTMPPPIAYWKFDEGEGTVAYDSVGDNDGNLINGPTWTTGQIDGALSFDGINDYVDVGDPADGSLDFGANDSFTLSLWFKRVSTGVDHTLIFKKEVVGGTHYEGYAWRIYNDKLYFGIEDTGNRDASITGSTAITDGRWHYAVAVRDVSTDKLYLYLDGVSDAAPVTDTTTTTLETTFSFWIGRWHTYDLYFGGSIDDVRVYKQALSAEEIERLYQEGLSEKASNPKPADGEGGVDPNVELIWSPGKDAVSHDVYFGTDFNEVDDADIYEPNVYMGNQDANCWDANSYDSNGLEYHTPYYWRIDENHSQGTVKGDVWSFTACSEPDINSGLVALWKFDEGTGTIAYDSAGDNDGNLINGPVWTTGQIGGGLRFDGVNDYVEVPYDDSIGPGYITLSAWVRPDIKSRVMVLIGKSKYSDSSSEQYDLVINTGGTPYSSIKRNSSCAIGQGWYPVNSLHNITVGQWHLITSTWDGSVFKIYVDGELDNSNTSVPPGFIDYCPGGTLRFGIWWSQGQLPFQGVMDDVRIYNRALTAEEVWQLYQGGL